MSTGDRKLDSPREAKEETQPPAEIGIGNPTSKWDYLAAVEQSKSQKDASGWGSWVSTQGARDIRPAVEISKSPTFDEQSDRRKTRGRDRTRSQSRGRGRRRSRSRAWNRSPRQDKSWGRDRSRSRERRRSRSGSSWMMPCRDFMARKCWRGSRCRFYHHHNVVNVDRRSGNGLGPRYPHYNAAGDKDKSWNGPTWEAKASSSDEPKATTWGDSIVKTAYIAAADKLTNDKWGQSLDDDSKPKGSPTWDQLVNSRLQNGSDGRSDDDRWGHYLDGQKKSQIGRRAAATDFADSGNTMGRGEDNKNSCNGRTRDDTLGHRNLDPKYDKLGHNLADKNKLWNGPTWDDKARASDEPKATGWGDSSTVKSADKQTDDRWRHSSDDGSKANGSPTWDKLITSTPRQNGSNGSSHDDRWGPWGHYLYDRKKSQDAAADIADTGKATWRVEEFKNSWNTNSHDPSAAEKQSYNTLGHSLEKVRIAWAGREWKEKAVDNRTTKLTDPNRDIMQDTSALRLLSCQKLPENACIRPHHSEGRDRMVIADGFDDRKGEKYNANCEIQESNSRRDARVRPFKFALVEVVREIIKPAWKQGKISYEVHGTIIKKVADKVILSFGRGDIPETEEHINHYLSCNEANISKLVHEYVKAYQRH